MSDTILPPGKRAATRYIDKANLDGSADEQEIVQAPIQSDQTTKRNIVAVKKDESSKSEPTNKVQKEDVKQQPNSSQQTDIKSQQPQFNFLPDSSNNGSTTSQKKYTPLFGNLSMFQRNDKGAFINTANQADNKANNDKQGSNTFANFTLPSINKLLQDMKDKNQKPSIFSTPSIFSNNNPFFNQGMSLFNFQNAANIPPIKHSDQTQENEQSDQNSAQLQKAQEMVVNPSESKANYEYKEQCKLLARATLKKYKKNNGDLLQNVQLLLQHDETNKIHFVVVRLTETKHVIFCGLINKKGVKCLNNRKDSLEIDSMEIKGKGERCKLKMQFSSEENCEEVLTKITSIVE